MTVILCLVLLVCCVSSAPVPSPHGFYYHTSYQAHPASVPVPVQTYTPGYQQFQVFAPQQQQTYHVPHPNILPLPLTAYATPEYIPAIPTIPIYSATASSLQGYSYQTQDLTGGRSQVLYVTGPNSQELFQNTANQLHFILPKLNLDGSQKTADKKGAPAQPATTDNYNDGQVIPPGKLLFNTLPLFMYYINNTENTTSSTFDLKEQPESTTAMGNKKDEVSEVKEQPMTEQPSEATTISSTSSDTSASTDTSLPSEPSSSSESTSSTSPPDTSESDSSGPSGSTDETTSSAAE